MNTAPNNSSSAYQPGVNLADLQLIIEKIPTSTWNVLRAQRIFITGGTGFIGCWLLEALIFANQQLELGITITALSRNIAAFEIKAPHLAKHKIITLLQGDVNNLNFIDSEYDVVIHAATDVVKKDSDALTAFNNIVNGTKETLSLAERCKAKRYLLTSSGAVYGRQPFTLSHIAENYLGAPDTVDINSAYGQAKRVSEWLAHQCATKNTLDVKVARCFALIGPYLPLDAHFAAGNFIQDGLNNKTIKINGDGTACRSYLYAADMTIWLLTILINGASGTNYNLGSDHAISIKELAENISNIIYGENRVSISMQPQENSPAQRYVPDISKAKNELNLFPYTDLQTAIQKTIDWELNNRNVPAKIKSSL